MPRVGIIIETPSLAAVGMPIVTIAQYEINREINAAGSFAIAFPATEQLAKQIKSRWRVTVVEEGRVKYLLYRGIVLEHTYRVNNDGTAIVSLAGLSRLYDLARQSTHLGLDFNGSSDMETIVNSLTGETVAVPASASTRTPKITFSDTSKLAALLTAIETARYNIRETFDQDGFELVEQDDVPDSGFRLVNIEQAGPELDLAAQFGVAFVAGTPEIGYSGKDVATRIIPVGTDFDGKPLTLQLASVTDSAYETRSALNPDGSPYYYIQDDDAVEANGGDPAGVIEEHYIRSDVANPSDDAGTRKAAADVLLAVACGKLRQVKSEVISFGCVVANGDQVDALPGDRIRIQYRGEVELVTGRTTWQDIDQDFLVTKRLDASVASGLRDVSFTFTAPEVVIIMPALPNAVVIPPPASDPKDPPKKKDDPKKDPKKDPPKKDPPKDKDKPDPPKPDPRQPSGAYQSCCADTTTTLKDGAVTPTRGSAMVLEGCIHTGVETDVTLTIPGFTGTIHFTTPDLSASLPTDTLMSGGSLTFHVTFNRPGTFAITATCPDVPSIHVVSNDATVQDFNPWVDFKDSEVTATAVPQRVRGIVILAFGTPAGEHTYPTLDGSGDCTFTEIDRWETAAPVTFGGDIRQAYVAYYMVATGNALTIDPADTGGIPIAKYIQWFEALNDLPTDRGYGNSGVDISFARDIQYRGPPGPFVTVTSDVSAGISRYGDATFLFTDTIQRSIDDFDNTYEFHQNGSTFNADNFTHDVIPQPVVHQLADPVPNCLAHSITMLNTTDVTSGGLDGATRAVSLQFTVNLHALAPGVVGV